jgi:hypothetical protein
MNSEKYFKEEKNNIGWIGSNFQSHFYGMEFTIPKTLELKTKTLERDMLDKEILSEWKPEESTLGELAYALQNDSILLKNSYANIFYIRDNNNKLWAVRADWSSGYRFWFVEAYSVGDPSGWYQGYRVLSRDWNFEPETPETMTLRESDSLKIVELEYKGIKYRLIEGE